MVYILLAPGFEEAEALVPADLLRRAGISVSLLGLEGTAVTGSHGITVAADGTLEKLDLSQAEMIVLPGGLGGVNALLQSATVPALLQEGVDRGIWLAAICAAPTIFARFGLLKDRRAVCYPGMEAQLTGAIPCPQEGVVVDGNIVTARAAGSAFDFGLRLISLLQDETAAEQVRHAVHYR